MMYEQRLGGRTPDGARSRSWLPDILGVLWVLGSALGVLVPALVHGTSLGPFDLLGLSGLSQHPGVVVHNIQVNDQIQQFIPWTTLAWQQVHQGHLPLWNPYNGLGLPLAFNWQSAPFSIPALIGYLVPIRLAYTIQVLVTLVVAGTGAYVFCRMLRVSVLGCMMAGTLYELSGPFMNWLGWPNAAVMSWAGWLFAAALLVIRGSHRVRAITLFAVFLACAIYAGFPEALFMLAVSLLIFVGVTLALRTHSLAGTGPFLRPVIDMALAVGAGVALGAPLLLPGLQLVADSVRRLGHFPRAFPLHDLTHVLFQGFDPVTVSLPIDPIESAAYVGVIGVVMAVTAVALRKRDPEVAALGSVGVITAALCFAPPVVWLADLLPPAQNIHWRYFLIPMAFSVAVLAGVGIDVLVRSQRERAAWSWAGAGFAVAALVLAALWVFGRGHLPSGQSASRAKSFIWPAIETVVGLAVVGLLVVVRSRHDDRRSELGIHRSLVGRRCAGWLLLACETLFLVAVDAPLWSSSVSFFTPTPAEVTLQRAVGPSVVGFGTAACDELFALGIIPNANIAYGVRELAVYDPAVPLAYARSWARATGLSQAPNSLGFCPAVTNAVLARRFGVGYVLEPVGAPGPRGAVFDMRIDDEDLYRIPGAAAATLTPIRSMAAAFPTVDAAGTPVEVTHPGPASWELATDRASPQVLRLRLTDVPGWHGSIDGQPLRLYRFSGVMLEARIPPGRHTVELHYWPTTFTAGIVIAACSAVGLLSALLLACFRRRHRFALSRTDHVRL